MPRWRYGRRERAFSDAFYLIMMGFTCRAAGSLDEKAAGTLILQES